MSEQNYRILTINPGSTSTKVALFENDTLVLQQTIRHAPDDFKGCTGILEQKDVRLKCVTDVLEKSGTEISSLSAIVGRGGLIRPMESGTYTINEKMLEDLHGEIAATHPSALGGIIAYELGRPLNIPSFIVDPVVVDEFEPYARLTGIPQVKRRSAFHALNAKAVAKRCAKDIGKRYDDCRFVVVHMGGGVSVGAHRYGRVIDVNDAMTGEGPFSPERCGGVRLDCIIEMCFSGEYTKAQMLDFPHRSGGMKAYIGTNDLAVAEDRIREGDETAALVVDTMAYQVCKEIGAMLAVLEGRADAVILTGGMARSDRFNAAIKQRIAPMATVLTYPGEDEMLSMAQGALRVLLGQERLMLY